MNAVRMPRVCVNSWIFGKTSIEEVFSRAAQAGFEGVELVGEPRTTDARQVARLAEQYNLPVRSICGMFPGPDPADLRALSHPDPAERRRGVDYVRACIDLASAVAARSVLVVPSLVGRPSLFASLDEDWKRAVESLQEAAQYAAQQGILLTIEPINRYEVGLVHSVADAIGMAREIDNPWVRVMGDTFHMQLEEPDGIPNAIRRAGRHWFQHLHVADNTREAPGRGTMDWEQILRALVDIEYEGVISFEPLPKGSNPYDARMGRIPAELLDRALAFGVRHLRDAFERVAVKVGGREGS